MWLCKGAQVVLVPEHMPETIARCLSDGWAECPDPRVMPARDAEPEAQPPPEIVAGLEREQLAATIAANAEARVAFNDMGMGPKPRVRGRR